MRALDLCAGAGGLSLGLQRAGFDVHGVEIDADAVETHRLNVGPCELADLWTFSPTESFDLVSAGIPCQSHSVAGNREGTSDPRGQLYKPVLRIAQEANARAILFEDVRNLKRSKSASHGTSLREILAATESAGFCRTSYTLLNSADYGTPQRRIRLFVVAFRSETDAAKFRWPWLTHDASAGLFGLQPWETVRRALRLGDAQFQRGLVPGASWSSPQGARMLDADAPATTVSTTSAELLGPLDRPAATVCVGNCQTGGGEAFADREYRRVLAHAMTALDRPSPTVLTSESDASIAASMRVERKRRKASDTLIAALHAARVLDRPATTVDTKNSLSKAGHRAHNKDGAVRLTVEQLAALQGLPEDFIWHGATVASKHRQVGNAVPPQLAKAVGRAIFAALSE